ncbi:MAG: neutral/alkaline non-lysosomal ceramidase N-terminal domain-containing protein, partial [Acidobacteriota bacterium]
MRSVGLLMMMTSCLAAEFRAAAVKVDITPDTPQPLLGYAARQSTGVLDKIWHRVVVFDDGREQFVLVATDIALVSPSVYDEVARDLQREMGIEPRQFWWTATHTHAAPEVGPPGVAKLFLGERYKHESDARYAVRVKQSLIEGVKQARARLEPARLTWGKGYSAANLNRRARDVDGTIRLGLNPDGPVDREIG